MSLQVNVSLAWILVILNVLCIGYLFIIYVTGGDMPVLIKRIQEGLTFTTWLIFVSDIFMSKVKDRWFWAIAITVLLPLAAPVYLWRRPGMVQKGNNRSTETGLH